MKARITVLLGLSLLLAAAVAYGQTPTLKVSIDFPFTVEGKTLPTGVYKIARTDDGMAFRVQGEGKEGGLAMIITRLNREMHEKKLSSFVVFDKVGEISTLSEIWFPGEDGYLVATTKEPHTHKTVLIMKK
jgi:hypothetical protein